MVEVVKASGDTEEFNRRKFLRSMMRGGSSKSVAQKVLDSIEPKLHDEITTREIYQLASAQLSRYDVKSSVTYDLKDSIMKLGPSGFPFEDYIGAILSWGQQLPPRALTPQN